MRGAARAAGLAAAAAASGMLCGLAFPLADAKLLAWVGLTPLLLALRLAPLRWAPALALLFSLGLWGVVWDWGPTAVVHYFEQSAWIGAAFFGFLLCLTLAPSVVLFSLAYRWLSQGFTAALPLLCGAAWCASELLRAQLVEAMSFGNPWAILGYSQVGFDALMQLSSVTGIYGVSFLLAAVNAALAEAALHAMRPRSSVRRLAMGAGSVAASVVLALSFGVATLRGAQREPASERAVKVGLVQPNLDPAQHWVPSHYGRSLDIYLTLSEQLAREQQVRLLFWPEAAMTFFLEEEPAYQRSLASYLRPLDLQLLAGAPRLGQEAFWNSVYTIDASGAIAGRYDKRVLLPFAEFAPLGRFDILRRSFGDIRAYQAGQARPALETRAGRAGVMVCNEAMYHEVAAQRVAEGAEFLVNAAHDGWIPAAEYAEMQLQLAVVRAIEQRRMLVRISTTGPSAIVDAYGRVIVRSQPFAEATLSGMVSPRRDRTLYARLGNAFTWASGATTLAACTLAPRIRRHAALRRSDDP